jgi:hypothetical protein
MKETEMIPGRERYDICGRCSRERFYKEKCAAGTSDGKLTDMSLSL